MFVAENFIRSPSPNMVSIQFTQMMVTLYPQACTFLHLKHNTYSPLERSLIERVMQFFNR